MSNRHAESDWSGGPTSEGMTLIEQIRQLVEAMAGTQVTDLELRENGIEIRLSRAPAAAPTAGVVMTQGTTPAAVPTTHVEPAEMSLAVMAPLTGVFYAAASPEQPPFVQTGQTVQAGQVVCVIEAMKVFNEIKTEIGGTVVAIPPKSGQLVKKGDPLVRIKPL